MSNNRYQIYFEKVLQLAQTIVIKSSETADAINAYIKMFYGETAVDSTDPTTWKYYKNIAGEYHELDTPMYVTSMDTLEKILFNKENLNSHKATANAFQFGTRNYQELVAEYPKQEMLILGILYPVDKTLAVSSEDGKILGYPSKLVESNEYNFITKLQTWIDGYKLRWTNVQFGISDTLYPVTMLGIMYLHLVPAILNIRLEACNTNEAHSYHVGEYLLSHGFLDSYLEHLTTKQALFFYRNIRYIERNVGSRDTFSWLVEHIMTERGLPLAEFTMRHDLSKQPEELYPELVFKRKPINLGYSLDSDDERTLDEILNDEDTLAIGNVEYREEHTEDIKESLENSLSNVVATKVLESSMTDYTDSLPYTLEDILLNMWLAMSATGKYTSVVSFQHPHSGERIPLSVKDAYVLMWYCMCRSIGINLVTVPEFVAIRIPIFPTPTAETIYAMCDKKLVKKELAVTVRNLMPVVTSMISIDAFYKKCVEYTDAANIQRSYVAYEEHKDARAQVQNVVSRLYSDNIYRLTTTGKTYSDWLIERNIVFEDFSADEFSLLYLNITREATGLSLNTTKSIKDLQAAMIKLLSQLSSYSIQFLTKINASHIRTFDQITVRIGDKDGSISTEENARIVVAGLEKANAIISAENNYDLYPEETNKLLSSEIEADADIVLPDLFEGSSIGLYREFSLETPNVRISCSIPTVANKYGILPVPGIDDYLKLTASERYDFKDVYGNEYYV